MAYTKPMCKMFLQTSSSGERKNASYLAFSQRTLAVNLTSWADTAQNVKPMSLILGCSAPFKILDSIIGWVSVLMVRLLFRFLRRTKCPKNQSMNEFKSSSRSVAQFDLEVSLTGVLQSKNAKSIKFPTTMADQTCNPTSVAHQVSVFVTPYWTPAFWRAICFGRHVAFRVKVACSEVRSGHNRAHFALSPTAS